MHIRPQNLIAVILPFFILGSLLIYFYLQQPIPILQEKDTFTVIDLEELQHVYVRQRPSLISAFYQFRNRPRAMREVLRRFRHFYPRSFINFYNDGGDKDITPFLAHHYGGLDGDNSNMTLYRYQYVKRSSRSEGLHFEKADSLITFFQRIIDTALWSQSDWVLLLEDDVWLQNLIDFTRLRFDLNGPGAMCSFQPEISYALQAVFDVVPYAYTGCGGSLINATMLRNMHGRRDEWNQWIRTIHSRQSYIASDQLVSTMMYLMNGTVGISDQMANVWKDSQLIFNRNISVLHHAKILY
jgi:hypothetical protein